MDESRGWSLWAELTSLGVLWSAASQPWESLLCLFLMPHFSLCFSLAEGDDEFDHFSTAETPSPSQAAAEEPWWDIDRAQTMLHSCSPIYSSKMPQFHRQQHRDAAGWTFLRNPFLWDNSILLISLGCNSPWGQTEPQTNKWTSLKQVVWSKSHIKFLIISSQGAQVETRILK